MPWPSSGRRAARCWTPPRRAEIEKLKARYRNIDFQLTDTQRILIETANTNMLEALRDAIIFTLLVILLFLGNFRAIVAALASIPMVFFATIAIRWMIGGDLNIVVYTAISPSCFPSSLLATSRSRSTAT